MDEPIVLFAESGHESMFFDPGYEADSTPGFSQAEATRQRRLRR